MSNVLPQEARRRVWRMYRARFVIAASLVFSSIAALAFLALAPGYLALSANAAAPAKELPAGDSRQDDRDAIVHSQALLAALSPLLSATTATELIERAVAARPAAVKIYHVTATAGRPGTVVLQGIAGSIEAISEYQDTLRRDKNFTGVSVPVGDLAGTADGKFSITLSANF